MMPGPIHDRLVRRLASFAVVLGLSLWAPSTLPSAWAQSVKSQEPGLRGRHHTPQPGGSGQELEVWGELVGEAKDASVFLLPYLKSDAPLDVQPLTATDARGHFFLSWGVEDSPFLILVAGDDFVELRGPFHGGTLPPPAHLRVGAQPSSPCRGRLVREGEPLGNATVTLYAIGDVVLPPTVQESFKVLTTADGEFSVPCMTGTSASLLIRHSSSPRMIVRVGPESWEVRVPRFQEVSGRVVEASGAAVGGARVAVLGQAEHYRWQAETSTDHQGRFELGAWLDEATTPIRVRIEGAGLALLSEDVPLKGSGVFVMEAANSVEGRLELPTEAPAALVRLRRRQAAQPHQSVLYAQTETDHRFRFGALPAGTYSLEIRTREYGLQGWGPFALDAGRGLTLGTLAVTTGERLAGRVMDQDGGPVAGARVRVLDGSSEDLEATWLPQTRTGTDGSFSVAAGNQGEIVLEVSKPGYTWRSVPVPQRNRDVLVVLDRRGGGIEGFVSSHETLDRPLVALAFTSDRFLFDAPDGDGVYHFRNLPAGTYQVHVMSLESEWKSVALDGATAHLDFGERQGLRVRGRVLVGDSPAANVIVRLVGVGVGDVVVRGSVAPKTNGAGRFETVVQRPGRFLPYLEFPTFHTAAHEVEIRDSPSSLEIRLPDTGIGGVVRNAQTGSPVAGARVYGEVLPEASERTGLAYFKAKTTPEGRFEVVGIVPGRYRLTSTAARYASRFETTLAVTAGETSRPLELALEPGRSVKGRILDEYDRPVPDVDVIAVGPQGERLGWAKSDDVGLFEIPALAFSRGVVLARSEARGAMLELPGSEADVSVEIRATRLGSVTIPNIDPGVEQAEVLSASRIPLTNHLSATMLKERQEVRLEDFPPGDYVLRLSRGASVVSLAVSVP